MKCFVVIYFLQARNSQLLAGDETDAAGMIEKSDDHVTSLGFKNDGYNYEKHLKVMGKTLVVYAPIWFLTLSM